MNTEEKSCKICDEVQKAIADHSSTFEKDGKYKEFEEYYQELKRLGLTKKQDYDVEPLDTIGRRAYEEMKDVWDNMERERWSIPSTRFPTFPSA